MEMEVKCSHSHIEPIEKLIPNPKNPNKHTAKQIEMLAKIMRVSGVRKTIVVSQRSGFMTAGHARLEAAKLNGWTHYPIDVQDYKSEAEEWADMVADNKIAELAQSDMEMIRMEAIKMPQLDFEMLGIPGFSIEEEKSKESQTEDEIPTIPKISRVRPGDLFFLGNHRLLCGDSTNQEDVAKLTGGHEIELCFTSPPYSDQRTYNGGKELSVLVLSRFIAVAAPMVKYFCVNLGFSRKDGEVVPYWNQYIGEAKNLGLKLLSWNVWDKGECGGIGNQNAMFGISHEFIFVFGKEKRELIRTVPNKNAGEINDHSYIREKDGSLTKKPVRIVNEFSQIKTVINCVPQKERDGIDHPARFPVRLPEAYIEAFCDEGQSVYEPFCGSGSTLIAAERLGKKCYAMELDVHYCDVILTRWANLTGKDPVRHDGKPWSELLSVQDGAKLD